MMDKVVDNSGSLADHELIEVLLCFAIPRKDTNPIAHRLIKAFGGIDGIFKASKAELMTITGVGDRTAELIITANAVFSRLSNKPPKPVGLNTTEKLKAVLSKEFGDKKEETCQFFLLDKNYNILLQLPFGNYNKIEVSLDLNEIVKSFASFKPAHVIMAHNHVTGDCKPSRADDLATQKIMFLCQLHGVSFFDHVIVMGETAMFSYRESGRLVNIKKYTKIQNFFELGGIE